MGDLLIASFVGRPDDKTSGSRRVTVCMNCIHWPGLFSVPRARRSSAWAEVAEAGISRLIWSGMMFFSDLG